MKTDLKLLCLLYNVNSYYGSQCECSLCEKKRSMTLKNENPYNHGPKCDKPLQLTSRIIIHSPTWDVGTSHIYTISCSNIKFQTIGD